MFIVDIIFTIEELGRMFNVYDNQKMVGTHLPL